MDALLHAALNNAAWAAALALAAAVGARIWRRHPAVIHLLWLMVLLKLVMPSLVEFSFPPGDRPSREHAGRDEPPDSWRPVAALSTPVDIDPEVAERSTTIPSRSDAGRIVAGPSREPIATASARWEWKRATVVLWLTGSMAWWLAVGLSSVRFRRLTRSARPAPTDLVERLGQVAARLGLRSVPAAWLLPARIPPMLWVPLAGSPRLVLPEELWGRLDASQRDAVLAHELAHLKRRDHWVRRLEAAVLGLYWWDPVAWWARREVERSEEECCDAWVVWALPQAADAYAEALVATAAYLSGLRRSLPIGASGVGSLISLKRRLSMIVCDSMKSSVVRSTPRAMLVLGILTLPFLPGLAAGKPTGEPAQAGAEGSSYQDKASAGDPAGPRPTETRQEPKAPPAAPDQAGSDGGRVRKVQAFQPISREVGEYVDVAEAATLSSPTVELRPRISGRVDRIDCRPGWAVKKGQVLFEIDPTTYQILLNKAEAEVRRTQARVNRCAAEVQVAKDNLQKGIGGTRPVSQAESQSEEAVASLQSAQADRDLAGLNLAATKVGSPIDGVISQLQVQPGDAVQASAVLARIVSLDPVHLDFYIGEDIARFLDRLQGGGRLKAGVSPELPISIGVRDEGGFPHRGKVDFLDPVIQSVAESAVHLRATIPNPDGSLAPGLRARIRLVTNARHKAILIPEGVAMFSSRSQAYVHVVDGQDAVQRRLVRVGLRYDDLREVEEGLKPDDWVVMFPGGVHEGQKVVPGRMRALGGSH